MCVFIFDKYYEIIDHRYENKSYHLARPFAIVRKIFQMRISENLQNILRDITFIIFHSMVASPVNCWPSENFDLVELLRLSLFWHLPEEISSLEIRN